jgi:uncharacterized membrane protein YccC
MLKVRGQELVFSVKAFAAAMLAFYLCSRFSLPQPSWAILTVYMVLNPQAGVGRSKALFRFVGSSVGAIIGVAIAILFSDSQELMLLVLGILPGLGVYFSLVDGTPKGYPYLLAGLTPLIVVLPNMGNPNSISEASIHRMLEIGLGIFCALAIDTIFFPQPLAPAVVTKIDNFIRDAEKWFLDIVSSETALLTIEAQQKLAADAGALDQMSMLVAYDPAVPKNMADRFEAIQRHMLSIIPRLYSLQQLKGLEEPSERLKVLMPPIKEVLEKSSESSPKNFHPIIEVLRTYETSFLNRTLDVSVTEMSFVESLKSALEDLQWIHDVRHYIGIHNQDIPENLRTLPSKLSRMARPKDRGMAALSGVAGAIAYAIACLIWAGTGTPVGVGLVLMAVVGGSFFGALDDPSAAGMGLMKLIIITAVFDALIMYGVYPLSHDFEILVAFLGIILIPLGVLLARGPAGLMPTAMVLSSLSFLPSYSAQDFAIYVESALCSALGLLIGALVNRVMRSVSADVMARRILKAGWREIAELTYARSPHSNHSFTAVMLRRLGGILPRFAALSPEEAQSTNILSEVRVGLAIASLKKEREHSGDGKVIDHLFELLREHFSSKSSPSNECPHDVRQLIEQLEHTQVQGERSPKILAALTDLRLNLKFSAA